VQRYTLFCIHQILKHKFSGFFNEIGFKKVTKKMQGAETPCK